jgi:hypothetical protein
MGSDWKGGINRIFHAPTSKTFRPQKNKVLCHEVYSAAEPQPTTTSIDFTKGNEGNKETDLGQLSTHSLFVPFVVFCSNSEFLLCLGGLGTLCSDV